MPELIRFKAEHWVALSRDDSQENIFQGIVRERGGLAYTAIDGERLLGCAGVMAHAHLGMVWALFSDELKQRYPLFLHKAARRYLSPVIASLELYRVEALVDVQNLMACKWITALGFERRELREMAGIDGRDAQAFVWLRKRLANE